MTPYYAVIFTSTKKNNDPAYNQMAELMESLAIQQDGYMHHDAARNEIGITVSYWKSLESISKWKSQIDHQTAQKLGRDNWYEWYNVRICKVEREYEFGKK
ncbi:antibiotic biosynthesis monooxygenase family protein [Nonlabens sp. Asnod2-A12]|uniref:antibiotic biosynthesis monooxygenase family protein n=1 Tax=Nonlabens sp. Asnod2-A12 TaxID=3160578 RepID=UPI003869FFAA